MAVGFEVCLGSLNVVLEVLQVRWQLVAEMNGASLSRPPTF